MQSFSTAIIPSPSRSTLIIPRSAQSSLSHCTTVRPGIDARSSGTTHVQLPLADHHAARVLPQVPRQILHPHRTAPDTSQCADASDRTPHAEMSAPSRLVLPRHSHWLTSPDSRPSVSSSNPSALPTSRAARLAAIRDHVRRHRRAQLAITLIHVLNRLLALLSRRQIEIDVRPLAPVLAQKPLEQQLHPHRIDRRNLQRITNRRIRRAAPSLHQNVVRLAVTAQCPTRSGSIPQTPAAQSASSSRSTCFCARFQQAPALASSHTAAILPPPPACAESCPSSRPPARDTAETHTQDRSAQTPAAPTTQHRVLHRLRHIAKQRRHLPRRPHMPLRVRAQQPPRMIQIDVMPHRRKQIQHLALILRRITHPVRRNHRQLQRSPQSASPPGSATPPRAPRAAAARHTHCPARNPHQPLHSLTRRSLPACAPTPPPTAPHPRPSAHQPTRKLAQVLASSPRPHTSPLTAS